MALIEPVAEPAALASDGPGPPVPPAAPPPIPRGERLARMLAVANEHEGAGRLDEAENVLGQLLSIAPNFPEALHLSGIVAFRRGRPDEALATIERSIELNPNAALFHRNVCEIYRKAGRYDDALAAGNRATALDPTDARALLNLSVLQYHRGEFADAIASAEKALALDPDLPGAHFGIAEAALVSGDFPRGWEEYEWRFRIGGGRPFMPPTDKPQWDGKRLPGSATLLLVADQGFGDVIQFSRFISWAATRCAKIAVACSRELHAVVLQQHGITQVFDRWEELPDFAAYCPLSGLPRLAKARLDSIPAAIPYIQAEPQAASAWAERLGALLPKGARRVGIAWAGRPTHPNDDIRSMTLATLAPLTDLPGLAFVSLQKGLSQAQIGRYWGRAPLINLGPELTDFAETMAVIDGLDLVVTVDTAVAHLAGAMGKPVWIMLPFAPDWRWLIGRSDSPWYPTVRLFRQAVPRQWAPVVEAVAAELAREWPGG